MLSLQQFLDPLGVSLRLAGVVSVLSAFVGTLAAYAFARQPRLRRGGAEVLFLLPMILPSLIVGLSFLVLFNLLGINSAWTELILAHIVITIPVVLQISRSLITTVDQNLESAAMTLGARQGIVIRRIVLPLLRPAIAGSIVLSFALSFDEFVIATLLSSGGVTTFPVELFQYMRFSINPTVAAISTVLIGLTSAFVWILHRVIGLDVLIGLQRRR
jgi:putative spermidine/putrescine transport system permease protein